MEEEKGGVVEGGGGLGNAPYRSAPRGPPIIGSAWRKEGGALRQILGSLDPVADADIRCTERCEGATGHEDGSPLVKKGAQINLRRYNKRWRHVWRPLLDVMATHSWFLQTGFG